MHAFFVWCLTITLAMRALFVLCLNLTLAMHALCLEFNCHVIDARSLCYVSNVNEFSLISV